MRFRNLGNFCHWNLESWTLESGIQLKESGILSTIEIRNPSPTEKESRIEYLESGIHGVESRIQTCLGFPYIGRQELLVQCPPPPPPTPTPRGSVAFKLLIEKSVCNLTGFVQAMEILESHGI